MRPLIKTCISGTAFTAILAAGLSFGRQPLSALPEYTEKERKECDFCHPSGDLFALNDAGKYYAEHKHSLEGYEVPADKPPEPAKPKTEPTKPKPAEPSKPK